MTPEQEEAMEAFMLVVRMDPASLVDRHESWCQAINHPAHEYCCTRIKGHTGPHATLIAPSENREQWLIGKPWFGNISHGKRRK